MKYTVFLRSGGWIAVVILLTGSLRAQQLKENRNNYPGRPPKTSGFSFSTQRTAPFVFSPHLSYKEQKQIQMAKKQAGGITFVVKSRRKQGTPENYKQPSGKRYSSNPGLSDQLIADTTAPFIRYDMTDTAKIVNP